MFRGCNLYNHIIFFDVFLERSCQFQTKVLVISHSIFLEFVENSTEGKSLKKPKNIGV